MSKYASLPDIDASGADVFETPDVPPEHTHSGESDSDDEYLNRTSSSPTTARRLRHAKDNDSLAENISQDRLNAQEARDRFARVERERIDKAGSVPRRLPSTAEYVSVDDREQESPLERLRRLRSEVAELEDEVRKQPLPTVTEGDSAKRTGGKKREVTPAVILQQLQMLRGDLQEIEPKLGVKGHDVRDESYERQFGDKAKAGLDLLARLGQDQPQAATEIVEKGAEQGNARRDTTVLERDGDLERRLAELEKMIGANEADVDQTGSHPVPLLATLTRLDHLSTLLTQPRHLDSISRRVKLLVSDLERIHESRRKLGDTRPLNVALQGGLMTLSTTGSGSHSAPAPSSSSSSSQTVPANALQKIDALFSLLSRLDPLLPLGPKLLTRLRSLHSLHQSSAEFNSTLTSLKSQVETLGEQKEGLNEVLHTLEQTFEGNQTRFEGNLKGLESRLEELGKRLDSLPAQN
ncbi:Jnm1p [Sporobolomyces koalae]|uniref:Jnm1p n=1 Tax=Sporobolomyces koalae TaxID=500713 RepID=UPI0031826437